MRNKKISYVLYALGAICVIASLLIKYILNSGIEETKNILLLAVGCILLGSGKFIMVRIKKTEGERYVNDLILSLLFLGLAAYAVFTVGLVR